MTATGRMRSMTWVLAALLSAPAHGWAQPMADAAWRLDVEALYATATVVWPVGRGWRMGPELGAGILEQVDLAPEDADFTSILHAGLALEGDLTRRTALGVAVRVGLGDVLRSCPSSDCLPQVWGGFALTGDWGWEHVRIGSRLVLGRMEGEGVVAWSPLFLRVRW